MEFVTNIFILLNFIAFITSETNSNKKQNEHRDIRSDLNYAGEKFQTQYFLPDRTMPTLFDLERYLTHLQRALEFFNRNLNGTDCNTAFASYITKSLLKRTVRDYRDKLQVSHLQLLSKLIIKAENIMSHYSYRNAVYDWADFDFRLSKILQNDEIMVHNIAKFNRNRLIPWVLSNKYMNEFVEVIDEGTLPKERYIKIVTSSMSNYSINVDDSDTCITRVVFFREPLDFSLTQACPHDDYCIRRITSEPSVGYALSHRMLNAYVRLKLRNCYMKSIEYDLKLIDRLCAFMYREAVYIARRGYFARDMFLEHITLCALMGYEEFNRMRWFNKALSWMNEYDCVPENRNYEINRTDQVQDQFENSYRGITKYRTYRCEMVSALCDDHPTALFMSVLGHAIRYTAHYMQLS